MQVNVFDWDYSAGKEKKIFLCSDTHIGNALFHEELFKQQFEKAVDKGCDIFINGDILDLIVTNDKKRYRKSKDQFENDDIVNRQIDLGVKFLKPYAKNIKGIGIGNHGTAYFSHHSFDPISALIRELRHENPDIRYMGYQGFLVFTGQHGKNGNIKKYIIFYNHGQGGAAEISKGSIGLDRRIYIDADMIWMGHVHQKKLESLPNRYYLDKAYKVQEKEVKGLITGCFLQNFEQYDIDKTGYKSGYGPERMRRPQARGGAYLTLSEYSNNIYSEVTI